MAFSPSVLDSNHWVGADAPGAAADAGTVGADAAGMGADASGAGADAAGQGGTGGTPDEVTGADAGVPGGSTSCGLAGCASRMLGRGLRRSSSAKSFCAGLWHSSA